MTQATTQVFLASRNAKKVVEMQRILAEHIPGVEVLGLGDVTDYDEPIEDQPTFEGNALLKARAGFAATAGGAEIVEHGRMSGRIIREVRGGGGFGYDVVFVADEHTDAGLTTAELDPGEKDRISHRGHAVRALAPQVAAALG